MALGINEVSEKSLEQVQSVAGAFGGDPARYDPEDLLVAAVSSCHMLWYLHLASVAGDRRPAPVPPLTPIELTEADYRGTGLSPAGHPLRHLRAALAEQGVTQAGELQRRRDGEWVTVAGLVICRQRPGTASGFMFLTLEDETGLVNVIVRPDLFRSEREVLVTEPVLEVEGVLQARDGLSVRAYAVRAAVLGLPALPARHFR